MTRAAEIRKALEKQQREVTCPVCGSKWVIAKATAAQIARLCMMAVPTWFRDATPDERMKLVSMRDGDNAPEPIRWLKGMEGAASMDAMLAELRVIVKDPRIVDEVKDPDHEISPDEVPLCCLNYLGRDAVADHTAEESANLKPFPVGRGGGES